MNHHSLEQFLSDCGSPEPIRVGVGQRDQPLSQTWTFQQPFLVIGRSPDSDLMLDHWQVSRRHAYLQLIEGRYYCVDLGSRTGTHGGDASERSGWLDRDRAIQIGPYSVRPDWPAGDGSGSRPLPGFGSHSARPGWLAGDGSGSRASPGVTWELPGRAIGQAVWRMDRPLVLVGRSPACRIRIVEPDVSKFHCSLVLTPTGVWVVDLLGQKGVYVNGEPVRCARLLDNDELRVGRHALRPRYDDEPSASAPPEPSAHPEPSTHPEPEPPASKAGELATIPPPAELIRPGLSDGGPGPGTGPLWPSAGPGLPAFVERPGAIVDPTVNSLLHHFGVMQQQMFDQFHHTMMMMFEGFAALHREQSGSLRDEFEQVRKLSGEIEQLRAETARLAETARPPDRGTGAANGHGGRPPMVPEPSRRALPPPPDPEVDIHAQLCLRLASIQSERQNRWQKILGMMSSRS